MQVVLGMLLRLDHLRIGQQQRAVVNGRQLAAIEQLGRAQHIRIVAAFERVAQDQVAQLRQKDRRQVAGSFAGQRDIDRLQRRRRHQPVAEIHHEGPVFARVGIGERGDVRRRHRAQRIGHQARMQIALGVAGIRRRHQFGPRQIGHDEFGRRDQPAVIGAAREVMARGDPEFSHVRSVVLRVGPDQPEKIDLFGRFNVAFDLVKGKGAGMGVQPVGICGSRARLEGAKAFADFAIFDAALHGEQRLRRVLAQRGRKCDLLLGGKARGVGVRRPEFLHQLPGEPLDHRLPFRFGRFGDDGKGRPSKTVDPEKARTQRHALLLAERRRIPVPEHERAGNRPFAGFRRPLENEGIRRVQPDGSRKFQHVRLIRISDRAPADHTKSRVQAHPQGCSAPAVRRRPAG